MALILGVLGVLTKALVAFCFLIALLALALGVTLTYMFEDLCTTEPTPHAKRQV